MNPNLVTIYKSPFPKKRLGRNFDGGYVIIDIPELKYDLLIAGGICDDISFEEDFFKFQQTPIYAFDGSITDVPPTPIRDKIRFYPLFIGAEETETHTNLHYIIDRYVGRDKPANLFIKMDIEGGEIPWIKSLSREQMDTFAQIAIEFHRPFGQEEKEVFEKLNQTHILCHLHPNNCCGTRIHNGVFMPEVFECTYLHKRFFGNEVELNMDYIPNDAVDMPNHSGLPEIYMGHPPFVHMERYFRRL